MQEDKTPSLRESFETVTEEVAESPLLRVLLSAGLPYVGAYVAELMAGKGQQLIDERREHFLQCVDKRLAELEKQRIGNKGFFTTPEGFDLLRKALEEALKTRSQAKREIYADILTGAITAERRERYSIDDYLNVVSSLSPQALEVARLFYEDPPWTEKRWLGWTYKASRKANIDENDLPMILGQLQALGLIQRDTGLSPRASEMSRSSFRKAAYRITPSFDRLMTFVEQSRSGGTAGKADDRS